MTKRQKRDFKRIVIILIIFVLSVIYLKLVNKSIEPKKTMYNEYLDYIEAEGLENTQENYQDFLKIYNNK